MTRLKTKLFDHLPISYKVILVILLSLAFRLLLLKYRFAVGFDEPHYLQLAASWRFGHLGDILHTYWPPMYPFLVGVMSFFIRDFEFAGRIVSILAGTLTLIPVYFLTKYLFDKKTAFLSVLLLAFYPALAFDSTNTLTEATYSFLALCGLMVGYLALAKSSKLYGLFAGLLFGAAYLTRPEGIGFLIVFVAIAFIATVFQYVRQKTAGMIFTIVLAVFGCAFISSPCLFYLKKQTNQWTLSAKWNSGHYDMETLFKLSDDNKILPVDEIWHDGDILKLQQIGQSDSTVPISRLAILQDTVENFYKTVKSYIPGVLSFALFVLFILGLFGEAWSGDKWPLHLYLLSYIFFFWLVIIPFFHPIDRYFLPLLPLCFVWISRGAVELHDWLTNTLANVPLFSRKIQKKRILGTIMVTAFLLVFSYLPELGKVIKRTPDSKDYWNDAVELKKAGLWLRDNTKSSPVIMSINKAVDYYAGNYDIRSGATIPDNSFARVMDYAKSRGVEYLVLTERYKDKSPQLAFLLETDNCPQGLELVHEDSSIFMTRIFKIVY
jgi:4-amino-4-deoxy-L-arabinose transferase-like glycosyltransferase